MADNDPGREPSSDAQVQRRNLMKGLGLGVGAVALGAATLGATTRPAAAAALTDADVFNFALNLEYLEAEYYLRAVTGQGLPASLTSGTGTAGAVTGGGLVPFKTSAVAYYAQRIANDELAHVRFIRTALGSSAVAEPAIDLQASFTTLALAAGLIVPGQTFDPFASEINFLLGAYVFEDVGVTAYAGAANVLTNGTNLAYAASILATEAYHAGAIRAYLSNIGGGAATDAISNLRAQLSGAQVDNGTNYNGNPFNFANVDINGQAFRRTPAQVLSVVYGGGSGKGLFFPAGVNGTIA